MGQVQMASSAEPRRGASFVTSHYLADRFVANVRDSNFPLGLRNVTDMLGGRHGLATYTWHEAWLEGHRAQSLRDLPRILDAIYAARPESIVTLRAQHRMDLRSADPATERMLLRWYDLRNRDAMSVMLLVVDAAYAAGRLVLKLCAIRDPPGELTAAASGEFGLRPPSRAQLAHFHQTLATHYAPQLEALEPVQPLARFLLPHQLRNALAMIAKEQLALGALEMLQHTRLRSARTRRLTDLIDVGAPDNYETYVRAPIDLGRDQWTPGMRVVTLINDDVGTGKTLSALSALALNGPRADNPWGLDPPARGAQLLPWIRHLDYDETAAWPERRRYTRRAMAHTSSELPRRPEPGEPGEPPTLSRNAQHGGTLLVVPHNVVDHWLAELARVEAMARPPAPWRVGVVGKGRLARNTPVAPRRLAEDYDVVVLPHTLMRLQDVQTYQPFAVFLPGMNWPAPRQPHLQYFAIVRDTHPSAPGETYLVHMTRGFLEARLQAPDAGSPSAAGRHTLLINPEDLISQHVAVQRASMIGTDATHANVPDAHPWIGAEDLNVRTIAAFPTDWRSPRTLTVLYTLVSSPSNHAGIGIRGACHYAGSHAEDLDAPVPAPKAVLHVRWARAVLDELHLLASPGTQRYRYVSTLEADNVVGLTAERSGGAAANHPYWAISPTLPGMDFMGGANNVLLASAVAANTLHCPPMRRSEIAVQPVMLADLPPAVDAADRDFWAQLRAEATAAPGPPLRADLLPLGEMNAVGAALRTALRQVAFGAEDGALGVAVLAAALAGAREVVRTARALMMQTQQPHAAARDGRGGEQARRNNAAEAAIAARMQPPAQLEPGAARLPAADLAGSDARIVCPICFEEDDRGAMQTAWVALRPCLHPLCEDCFDSMREHRTLARSCSLCRRRITAYVRVQPPEPEEDAAAADAPRADAEAEPPQPRDGLPAASAASGQGGRAEPAAQADQADQAQPAAQADQAQPAAQAAPAVTSKRAILGRLLQRLLSPGDGFEAMNGAVIFCDCRDEQMAELQAWLGARLEGAADVRAILSSHSAAARARTMQAIAEAAAARPQVLLVRYRMCAVGVNFIFADNVIFYTTPHRADYVHQAVGRICRLGQTRPRVRAWTVAYRGSLEAAIWEAWLRRANDTAGQAADAAAPAATSPSLAVVCKRYWEQRLLLQTTERV